MDDTTTVPGDPHKVRPAPAVRQAHVSPNTNGCGFYYDTRPIDIEYPRQLLAGRSLAKALIRLFNGG